MAKPFHTKTFRSGNSVAVRLPKGLEMGADIEVTAQTFGDGVWIRPAAKRQSVAEMVERLRALGPLGEIGERDAEIPERPGL